MDDGKPKDIPVAAYEPESMVMEVDTGADGIESSRYLMVISIETR